MNDLSITENIMLGRTYPKVAGVKINWAKAKKIARDCLARTGPPIDVDRSVGEFGIADRTRIAIARALPDNDDPALIVLDEPTHAHPARAVEALFDSIRRLTADAHSAIRAPNHLSELPGVAAYHPGHPAGMK